MAASPSANGAVAGAVDEAVALQAVEDATDETTGPAAVAVPALDPNWPRWLNTQDIRRARVALDGKDPFSLINGDREDMLAVLVFCLRSRTDPAFTWAQAQAMPFGEMNLTIDSDEGEVPPPTRPPTPAPPPSGAQRGKPRGKPHSKRSDSTAATRSPGKPPESVPEPSSASSTG